MSILSKVILFALILLHASNSFAEQVQTASWYSEESCKREGTSGICANGEVFDDKAYTCASWDHAFGTILCITNVSNGKRIMVTVTDRGPAKRLYAKGRTIDLSRAAFGAIANLKSGIIQIEVRRIK